MHVELHVNLINYLYCYPLMCDCDGRVTLICQIQSGSVLSSVILQDDLVHPGVLL